MRRGWFSVAMAVLGSSVLSAAPAAAGDYWCNSLVSQVGVDSGDQVWLQISTSAGGRWLYVCSLSPSATSPSAAGCQSMHATLLSAKALGKQVEMHLVGTHSATSCATNPGWNTEDRIVWLVMWP